MALILAVNPGGTQSGTLARVARELQEYELVGADSCAVAMAALDDHKPALVLLPASPPAGEPELLERLRTLVRGGVPTLRLPPPTSVNPKALADQIRQSVGAASPTPAEEPPQEERSEHLVTAAKVAASWIRARRATWATVAAPTPAPAPIAVDYGGSRKDDGGSKRQDPPSVLQTAPPDAYQESESGDDELAHAEPAGPSAISRAVAGVLECRATIVPWLPRAAGLAAAAIMIWAATSCWPQLRTRFSGANRKAGTAGNMAARGESAPAPGGPPARGSSAATAAADSQESKLSGWIAVFSPVDVRVSEGAKAIALDDRSRAMLSPGSHTLRFQNRALGYDETRTVQITSIETATLNLTPRTRIDVTSTETAEVFIDGTKVGDTPIRAQQIDLGTHSVVVKSPAGERQIAVSATSTPVQLNVDFSKP